ncbi:MAG: hypothetical protein AAGF92_02220 [Myxococcota bacterium]
MFAFIKKALTGTPWPSPAHAEVTFDDHELVHTTTSGTTATIPWADLTRVQIVTTNAGPFACDLFWRLTANGTEHTIASEAHGTDLLLERLQALPGFNNEAVIEAMGSTHHATFEVWARS